MIANEVFTVASTGADEIFSILWSGEFRMFTSTSYFQNEKWTMRLAHAQASDIKKIWII